MSGPATSLDGVLSKLRAVLEPHGVFLRGVVNFSESEAAPVLEGGRAATSIVLLGNIGSSIWAPFQRWRKAGADKDGTDPLDRWSKMIIEPVAQDFGATAYFPSDPPWQPFQRWAMHAEGLQASPLGILIHPQFGLWHGYRGALGFSHAFPESAPALRTHPCDDCVEKPCLTSCPADAISAAGFQISPCRAHLKTVKGRAGCMIDGCLARNSCPIGAQYRYRREQLQFHMTALNR